MPTPSKQVERKAVVDRIVADNDPRNGNIATRLIRLIEQPDRRPNADGLYADAPAPDSSEGGEDQ